jgi:hypothetical protein
MSRASDLGDAGSAGRPDTLSPTPAGPLSPRDERRNILVYAANRTLIYLASPVTYLGLVRATLLDRLGFDRRDANLPAGVYLWATPLAVVVVVWLFPRVRQLRPLLVASFLSTGVLGGVAAAAVLFLPPGAVLAALVVHTAWWGCANGVVATCQWLRCWAVTILTAGSADCFRAGRGSCQPSTRWSWREGRRVSWAASTASSAAAGSGPSWGTWATR